MSLFAIPCIQDQFKSLTNPDQLFTQKKKKVDGNFVVATLNAKLDVENQLPKILVGATKHYTTSCVMDELRRLGDDFSGAFLAAKRFERRNCTHHPCVSGRECLETVVGDLNKQRLVVATQDLAFRKVLREIPGVPLLYLNRSVVILEPPSAATSTRIQEVEIAKTRPMSSELRLLKKKKSDDKKVKDALPIKAVRKKKAKGPNPLSIRRRKPEDESNEPGAIKVGGTDDEVKDDNANDDTGNDTKTQKEPIEDVTPALDTGNLVEPRKRRKRKHRRKGGSVAKTEGDSEDASSDGE